MKAAKRTTGLTREATDRGGALVVGISPPMTPLKGVENTRRYHVADYRPAPTHGPVLHSYSVVLGQFMGMIAGGMDIRHMLTVDEPFEVEMPFEDDEGFDRVLTAIIQIERSARTVADWQRQRVKRLSNARQDQRTRTAAKRRAISDPTTIEPKDESSRLPH